MLRPASPVPLFSDELQVVVDPRRGADILQIRHRAPPTPPVVRGAVAEAGRLGPRRCPSSQRRLLRALAGRGRGGAGRCCARTPAPSGASKAASSAFMARRAVVPWAVAWHSGSEVQLSVELFSVPVPRRTLGHRRGPPPSTCAMHWSTWAARPSGSTTASTRPWAGHCWTNPPGWTPTPPTLHRRLGGARCAPRAGHRASLAARDRCRRGSRWTSGRFRALSSPRALFGWLAGFPEKAWARLSSPACGVSVHNSRGTVGSCRMRGCGRSWAASGGFPWFGRARALAVEPGTTVTSGPGRADGLELAAGERRTFAVSAHVESVHLERSHE